MLFRLRGDGRVLETDFGRGGTCHAEQSGYDRYVDGELVERVVDVVWVGDCEWNSPESTLPEPVGFVVGDQLEGSS